MSRIAVVGATGRQGGAIARRMLKQGWDVRALTRHSGSAASTALRALGATIAEADLGDAESLARAMTGCTHLFGVTDYWEHGLEGEILLGRNLVTASKSAAIQHVLFSSVGATDRTKGLGISHFDSKRRIEEVLMASGLKWTILRPVTFLENFLTPRYLKTIATGGTLRFGFAPGKRFQMVAMDDLAHFAALALKDDSRIAGKATEIASDSFTMEAFVAALSKASGKPLRYQCLNPLTMRLIGMFIAATGKAGHYRAGLSLVPQFQWNNADPGGGWDADIDNLRAIYPALTTMEQWVARQSWR